MKRARTKPTDALFQHRLQALLMEGYLLVEGYNGRRPRRDASRNASGELFAVLWDGDHFWSFTLAAGLVRQAD